MNCIVDFQSKDALAEYLRKGVATGAFSLTTVELQIVTPVLHALTTQIHISDAALPSFILCRNSRFHCSSLSTAGL